MDLPKLWFKATIQIMQIMQTTVSYVMGALQHDFGQIEWAVMHATAPISCRNGMSRNNGLTEWIYCSKDDLGRFLMLKGQCRCLTLEMT